MEKHWIITAPDNDEVQIERFRTRKEFVSERQALKVAEILAIKNPGKRFVVYEALAVSVSEAVLTQRL